MFNSGNQVVEQVAQEFEMKTKALLLLLVLAFLTGCSVFNPTSQPLPTVMLTAARLPQQRLPM